MRVLDPYQVNTPINIGAVVQVPLRAHSIGLPISLPATGTITSALILTGGYTQFSVGLMASQNGVLSVDYYLDEEGFIPQESASPLSINFVADKPVVLNPNGLKLFQSMRITLTNAAKVEAQLIQFILLLQAI